jgi:hypothetical protein
LFELQDGPYAVGTTFLTQDRASIFDWEEISSNREAFNDVFQQCEQEQDNVVVWTCSFCEANNVVNRGELKFARNNSRVIERPAGKV